MAISNPNQASNPEDVDPITGKKKVAQPTAATGGNMITGLMSGQDSMSSAMANTSATPENPFPDTKTTEQGNAQATTNSSPQSGGWPAATTNTANPQATTNTGDTTKPADTTPYSGPAATTGPVMTAPPIVSDGPGMLDPTNKNTGVGAPGYTGPAMTGSPILTTGPIMSDGPGMLDPTDKNTSVPPPTSPLSGGTPTPDGGQSGTPPGTNPTSPIAQPAPATTPTIPNTPTRSADMDALIKQLQARAMQSGIVTGDDPRVRSQADAYAAQQERSRRNYLADQAEGNSPYSTGAQAGLERMTAEQTGQANGAFESTLINNEMTARRDEIKGALDSLGNMLSDEEKNGLERELANLNASIDMTKANMQNNQFFAGLNEQDKQFMQNLMQQDKFKGMDDTFNRMKLAQDNSQFIAQLAQTGKLADMQDALEKMKLSQQDQQFIANLAQQGKFAEMEDALKRATLSQDNNQFIAQLAQQGKIAEMDDLFNRMKLMQEQSQFLDRLGFDETQQRNYWDWISRGNAPPSTS